MINKIFTKVFLTYTALITILVLQGCKEMSSLTSDGVAIKKATTPTATTGDETTTPTTTAPVATVLSMTAPTVVEVNQCVPLIISLKNGKNETVAAAENMNVLVTGAPGTLYTNNTCSTIQSTTVAIAKNALSKTIYVTPTANQSYVIDLEDVAMKVSPSNFILSVTNPAGSSDALKLAVTGPGSLQAGQCRSYVVSLQNTLGANKNASALTALTLSGQGSGTFHTGTNCSGGSISTLNLPMGSSFISFSYQNSTAENVNFVVDSPVGSTIQSAFFSTQVTALSAAVPTQLVLTGPTSVTAGACSGPVVVKTVDASFNSTAVASNLPITISGGGGFAIFTNASCSTTLASPQIAALSSSMSFYFSTSATGNVVISADDSGSLTDAAIGVQSSASSGSTPVKFVLSGPASVLAGACSAGYTIKTTNGSGVDSAVSANTAVNITGKGSGDFYTDASCATAPISSVTFSSGDSAKSFYYKGASVANLTFNVDDVGPLTPASISVSVVPDIPTQLAVTGPSPIVLGECRAYTVTTKDANNFVSTVSGTTSINLTGAGSGAFYSDSSCINSTSSIVVNSGQSGALFYYKSPSAAASITLSADNSGGLTTGTRTIAVDALPYSKLVFTRPTLNAGVCTAITITLKDSLNNSAVAASGGVGVTLSSTGGASFYSANSCAGGVLITSSSIVAGSSSAVVYLKDNISGSITLGASSTGLSSDSWTATVNPAANAVLKIVGPATNSVGACTAYDLKLEDSLGNLSPATSSTSINFTGLSNAKFYSDSACSIIANSMTLSIGTSLAQIYLKGTTAESITATASSGGLTPASTPVSLIAGSSNKLVINGVATASAGACTALTVGVQDSFNNAINQGSNLVVTMLGNGSGSFYSENTCTTPASTVTVTTGNSSGVIYYKSNAPASLSFTAQGSGLFDGTKSFAVNPLAPSKLVMTGPATITSGVCTAYSISLQDTLNNLSSAGTAKTLNFSGALSGAFYSDSSCALPASSISLSSSQTTASIYYKASAAQTPNLSVDDVGLPDLAASTLPITVNSSGGGTAIALKISGATSANTNTCIPYAVMTTDSSGLSYNVTSNMTATLAGAGTGAFYSNSGCSVTSSTVTITTGTSLSYIYYMSSTAQNLVFSATASGASATTLPVAITSSSGPSTVTRLTMTGSNSILTNACIPYIISSADSNGNSMNTTSTTAITLSGKGSGDYFTDDACTISAAGAASIASGSSFTTVYYKNAAVQNLILIAQSTGLSNGTLSITTSATSGGSNAGPAVKLAFVAQPSSVASTSENFGIQPIVAVQDSNNNVASSSAATITLAAFTDSACTLSAGSVLAATTNPLNATGGVANFAGVNISSAQTLYIRASSPGLASACSSAVQVYPSVAAKLAFSTQPSTTVNAGVNLTTMPQVSVLNYTNQVVTNATNTVTLAAFSDNSCTTPVSGTFNVTSANIIPNSGVATYAGINYSLVSTIYLKASASGLTSACSSGITVDAGTPASVIVFTQPQATGKAGDNFSLVARLYDTFGNLSPAAHNLSLTAYKSSNCSGATTTLTGSTATSVLGTANFSGFSFSESGTMSVKVSDVTDTGVVTSCTNPILVDGGTPTKITISTQPSATGRIYTALSTPPVFRIEDANSNLVTGANNQVTLAAFTNNTCTTPATGTLAATSLTVQSAQGLVPFSGVTYSAQETIYFRASSSGLTSVCTSASVFGGLPAKIAVGNNTSCSVVNGGVWCWGYGGTTATIYGKLGDNSSAHNATAPVQVVGVGGTGFLSNITDVSVGDDFICALSSSGNVYCWGYNAHGQLGDATTAAKTTPVVVVGTSGSGVLSNIVSIKSGGLTTCALNSSGNVFCWGYNAYSQIGDNTSSNRSVPTQVVGVGGSGVLGSISQIAAGYYHFCAINNTGSAYCWGYNNTYQVDSSGSNRAYPFQVVGVGGSGFLTNLTSISGGYSHTCASNSSGAVYCWGSNGYGQLGDNTLTTRTTPVQTLGVGASGFLSGVSSVSGGYYYNCALQTAGGLHCWGQNTSGQLGINSTTNSNTPAVVKDSAGTGSLTNNISVAAGNSHTCSLAKDGAMYCWGINSSSQLGDQSFDNSLLPVRVKDALTLGYTSMSVGATHTCAVAGGKVYCWGENTYGKLGDGTTTNRTLPTLVSSLNGVKDISTYASHTCALMLSGSVYCWGYNGNAQLGDGTTTNRSSPVQVLGVSGIGYLSGATSLSVSDGHSCVSTASGEGYCWGLNNYYQLGDGTTTLRSTPVKVSSISNINAIFTGPSKTCALVNGAANCWGYNGSYLAGFTSTPSTYYGTSGVTSISLGSDTACFVRNGAGLCYGSNYVTQAGGWYGVSGAIWSSGVTKISAGRDYNCAVVNQRVQCYNSYGSVNYSYVYTGGALQNVQSVGVNNTSYQMTCALKLNGALYCWGYNSSGVTVYNGGVSNNSYYPSAISMPSSLGSMHGSLAVGETFSCGVLNGAANCWGTSAAGALGSGNNSSTTPKPVVLASNSSGIGTQQIITAGSAHACALNYGGDVYCWGDNTFGRLGNNSTTSSAKAVQVVGVGGVGTLSGVSSLSAGYRHNCAVSGSNVYCWGNNGNGQLGINSTMSMATPTQVKGVGGTGNITGISQVVSGRLHSCALTGTGNVYCWGSNTNGQLGNNSATAQSNTPVQVVSVSGLGVLDSVTSITAGAYHTCALSAGTIYCWGSNSSKQLGNDSNVDSSYPVGVMNSGYVTLTGISAISSGAKHSCGTTSLNEAFCWGNGINGQLGSNSTLDVGVASSVVGVGGSGQLATSNIASGSSSNHSCALSVDLGSVYCWGSGASGQLGNGTTTSIQLSPTAATITSQPYLIVK